MKKDFSGLVKGFLERKSLWLSRPLGLDKVRTFGQRYGSREARALELSHSSWLVGGVVPGIERQPRQRA